MCARGYVIYIIFYIYIYLYNMFISIFACLLVCFGSRLVVLLDEELGFQALGHKINGCGPADGAPTHAQRRGRGDMPLLREIMIYSSNSTVVSSVARDVMV